jgi:hypothetical protein
MRDPTERLKDILDAIANIERYAARGREAFERDELILIWVLYHIQLIHPEAMSRGTLDCVGGTQSFGAANNYSPQQPQSRIKRSLSLSWFYHIRHHQGLVIYYFCTI